MNNIIEFKKDCIMKTMVSEITDISLTHDYKILSDRIEGYFDVTGEYKITKSSIEKEEFMYTIPFTISLSSLIDTSTINLTIHDFKYTIDKDVLHLKMALKMEYEEIKEEIKETKEEEIKEEVIENITDTEKTEEYVKNMTLEMDQNKEYSKYKIYIMREEDTIESVAIKYNTSLDILKEYNDIENIKVKDKIIIPIIDEKQD